MIYSNLSLLVLYIVQDLQRPFEMFFTAIHFTVTSLLYVSPVELLNN